MFEQRPLEVLISYVAAMAIGAVGLVITQQYINFKLKRRDDAGS